MPLIHVWNYATPLLHGTADGDIPKLAHALGRACVDVPDLGIKDGTDTLVSFQGKAGRAEARPNQAPMLIIVDLLYAKSERTLEVRQKLAEAIGRRAKEYAREDQAVEVFVRTFNSETEASWFSNG